MLLLRLLIRHLLVSSTVDPKIGSMATKSQHSRSYQALPGFLRTLREEACLPQRELGKRLRKPQSWVYNCEVANRRVDVAEFIAWAVACDKDPQAALPTRPAGIVLTNQI
jgi:hypothetical protein